MEETEEPEDGPHGRLAEEADGTSSTRGKGSENRGVKGRRGWRLSGEEKSRTGGKGGKAAPGCQDRKRAVQEHCKKCPIIILT
jgi:hypothetical protein